MASNGSRMKKLLRTMLITGLAFTINYLITLFLTPFITNNVGTAAYGYVSLAKNMAQYAAIITLALNSFASRHIAVAYHNGDLRTANIYFSSTFFGDLLLGTAIAAVSFLCIAFLDKLLVIEARLVGDVKLLFVFVFIRFFLVTVFSVYGTGAYIADKLDVSGVFKLLSYMVEAVVLLVIFRLTRPNVAFVGLGLLSASLVLIGADVLITRRHTPSLAVRRSNFRKSAVHKLVADGVWSSANDLGALLHSGLDLAICNLMLTPLAMGQLAIAKSIDLIFHSLYHVVGHAFQPMLLRSYAENNMKRLLGELNLSMKFSALLSNLAFAGFFALGMVYYKLWIPNEDIALVYQLTVITVLTSVASGSMKPLYYIYTLTVKQKFPCVITLITGALNVISMMVLLRFTDLGVYAVVWTTVVLVGFINFVSNPLYMAHVLGQPLTTFYPGIIRNVSSCAVLTALFTVLSRLYMPSSWLTLFACIAAYALIGAPVHFLIVLSREEKKMIVETLKKRFKHM